MVIKILKAFEGDAILLSFEHENVAKNILIDGGPSRTYSFKNEKGKIIQGDLAQLVEELNQKNQFIDLLIVTHVDDDHIGGVLGWMEKDPNALERIKKVWFNSGSLINQYFNRPIEPDNAIDLAVGDNGNTSIKQGSTLEKYIDQDNIWEKEIILKHQVRTFLGLEFKFLSPGESDLKKLLGKWKKEDPGSLDTSAGHDYELSLKDHIEQDDTFEFDRAIHNGSSIAFILKYYDSQFVFLADAHADTIVESLAHFHYDKSRPLRAELVKVSHHGSKFNNSKEMFDAIESYKYIFSTNGEKHGHPHKRTIARIVQKYPKSTLIFNYGSFSIFQDADLNQFSDLKILENQSEIQLTSR